MKNCIFILLWCIPGFLFSVTPKPDVEKLTETADTYYQAGKVDLPYGLSNKLFNLQ